MSTRMALAAGTVLSLGAVAAIASQDPGPVTVPPMPARHPLASYMGIAGAPFGNWWALFAFVALIFSVCIFIAGLRQEHRHDRRREP